MAAFDRTEYNRIMMLLEGSHSANHPSIKRFRLQNAIEATCEFFAKHGGL